MLPLKIWSSCSKQMTALVMTPYIFKHTACKKNAIFCAGKMTETKAPNIFQSKNLDS